VLPHAIAGNRAYKGSEHFCLVSDRVSYLIDNTRIYSIHPMYRVHYLYLK
jgi:hypothetical protein